MSSAAAPAPAPASMPARSSSTKQQARNPPPSAAGPLEHERDRDPMEEIDELRKQVAAQAEEIQELKNALEPLKVRWWVG